MIEIKNVSMDYVSSVLTKGEKFRALDDITLTVPEGCIYGFIGSNGAGKSTLMRLLCGVYRTQEGSITIDGEGVYDNPSAKSKIFFVNDETVQYAKLTLSELKRYYAASYPDFSAVTFDRLTNSLGLPQNKRMSDFSKGMKRQAVVVAGLSAKTKYLMLDEAFDGLDPAMRKVVKDMIIDEMLDRNATLIISSHNVTEMNELCDRAMLIHKGKLVFSGDVDEIKSGFKKIQLLKKDCIITETDLKLLGLEVMKYSVSGSVVQAIVKGEDDIAQKIDSLQADVAETIPLTFEEVFIYELQARGYGNVISEN